MNKISVCLATFNEEKNIKDCLESVKWADEIVIVDGESTDKTRKIAGKYTDRIIVRENPPMFHINKQKAFEAATGDWILYLDADERVSGELKEEILKTVGHKSLVTSHQANGYWIPRKNIIFGKWISHSQVWWPDYQLRLFKRGKAYLPCQSVHEQPKLSGQAGYLKNPLIHYNYQTVFQYVQRINHSYSENDANLFLLRKKRLYWYDAIRFPLQDFLSTFFARESYKDGLHGLVLSLLQAFSALVTFAKIWEKQGFKEENGDRLPEGVKNEFKTAGKEFRYWLTTSKLAQTKNPVMKMALRVKRRLGL